jgi:predicted Zn-dependent protease
VLPKNSNYNWDFHLLADDQTINAFALPGQCFITAALYSQLGKTKINSAVMGHEIGHVIKRHSAENSKKGYQMVFKQVHLLPQLCRRKWQPHCTNANHEIRP